MSAIPSANTRILVWDAPTRVFHWLLAASFVGAYVTSESERFHDIHLLLGYTLLGLIAFRILWGLIGTRYAGFRSFAFGPSQVIAYLRSRPAFFSRKAVISVAVAASRLASVPKWRSSPAMTAFQELGGSSCGG